MYDGQRNGAQTCRTYQRGPAECCAVALDGSISAMQLHELVKSARLAPGATILCTDESRALVGAQLTILYAKKTAHDAAHRVTRWRLPD